MAIVTTAVTGADMAALKTAIHAVVNALADPTACNVAIGQARDGTYFAIILV